MSKTQKSQDKIFFFDSQQNLEKKLELSEKILPLINGYTIKQIEESFQSIMIDLKCGFIINLED